MFSARCGVCGRRLRGRKERRKIIFRCSEHPEASVSKTWEYQSTGIRASESVMERAIRTAQVRELPTRRPRRKKQRV